VNPDWVPELVETKFDLEESGVAWITLDRPEKANARNQRMREELLALYDGIRSDDRVRVVVLTAAGERHFCAGMDLKESAGPETQAEQRARLRAGRDIEELAALPVATIAAVNGAAYGGGCEMALACDLRIVSDDARLRLPEVTIGLVPGGGATQRLPRMIGVARTFEMLYLGTRLTGPEIVAAGLATRSVAPDELRATAAAMATGIAELDPTAVRMAKELVQRSLDVPLGIGAEAELDSLLMLLQSRRDEQA
jgi:enoyl-CoA hydratase/carnithine racemase